MQRIEYAMQFTGNGAPAGDDPSVLTVTASAPSSSISSKVGMFGLSTTFEDADGAPATFESTVHMADDGSFSETGRISFGTSNWLEFESVAPGHAGPSPVEGTNQGAVVWRMVAGGGQFEGAAGLITSNFTLDENGGVIDNQFGVLFTP